jgi:hypothetical protein
MKRFLQCGFVAAIVAGAIFGARLWAIEITLPVETARLAESPLAGYNLAVAHCSTCHSVDYVRMQPPGMTRAAWRASVVKMQKTFGAPIPDGMVDRIAEYLVKTYGAERTTASTPNPAAPSSTPATAKRP